MLPAAAGDHHVEDVFERLGLKVGMLASGPVVALEARQDDQVSSNGWARVHCETDAPDRRLLLSRLAPSFRGAGSGKSLFLHGRDEALHAVPAVSVRVRVR